MSSILRWTALVISTLLLSLSAVSAAAAPPVDEETMARFEALHDSMAQHQNEMEQTTSDLTAKREKIARRLTPIEEELKTISRQRPSDTLRPDGDRSDAMRAFEERKIEAKSRYLELLTEQHSIDVELYRSFVRNGGAILGDLERYAETLEKVGTNVAAGAERTEPIQALQVGTARVLAAIEDWGDLTREDPRFRALWQTARMLGKAQKALEVTHGNGASANAVKSQISHVRSLLDQAVVALKILEAEGGLIQVAAQSLTFRLLSQRMGNFGGTELIEIDFEDRMNRVTSVISEEPAEDRVEGEDVMLVGFDSCADRGICD